MVRPNRWQPAEEELDALARQLSHMFEDEFDRELSTFQARSVLEFCAERLGPAAYNRGVSDARGALEQKLEDVEAELFQESPRR